MSSWRRNGVRLPFFLELVSPVLERFPYSVGAFPSDLFGFLLAVVEDKNGATNVVEEGPRRMVNVKLLLSAYVAIAR